jgi:hypothetical protein
MWRHGRGLAPLRQIVSPVHSRTGLCPSWQTIAIIALAQGLHALYLGLPDRQARWACSSCASSHDSFRRLLQFYLPIENSLNLLVEFEDLLWWFKRHDLVDGYGMDLTNASLPALFMSFDFHEGSMPVVLSTTG